MADDFDEWEGWDDYGSEESIFDILADEAADALDVSMEDAVAAVRKIREERQKNLTD